MSTPTRRARTGGSLMVGPEQVEALRKQLGQPSPSVEPRRSARQVELARRLLEAGPSTEMADREDAGRREGPTVLIEELTKEDTGARHQEGDFSRHRGSTSKGNVSPPRGDRATEEAGEGARSPRLATHEEEAEAASRPAGVEAFEGPPVRLGREQRSAMEGRTDQHGPGASGGALAAEPTAVTRGPPPNPSEVAQELGGAVWRRRPSGRKPRMRSVQGADYRGWEINKASGEGKSTGGR